MEMRNTNSFFGKPEEKRRKCEREENIKMDRKKQDVSIWSGFYWLRVQSRSWF
jgi:hypothetical protein